VLEKSVNGHRHARMMMKTLPGSLLEVVETKFLFQTLLGPSW